MWHLITYVAHTWHQLTGKPPRWLSFPDMFQFCPKWFLRHVKRLNCPLLSTSFFHLFFPGQNPLFFPLRIFLFFCSSSSFPLRIFLFFFFLSSSFPLPKPITINLTTTLSKFRNVNGSQYHRRKTCSHPSLRTWTRRRVIHRRRRTSCASVR